jgi:hypothetical protein
MTNAYDRDRAARLVPLLRSITREIRDRTRRIDALRRELELIHDGARSRRYRERQAELAIQLRELRLANAELERLGCSLDRSHPLRVLIPADGGATFAWRCGSSELDAEVADSTA